MVRAIDETRTSVTAILGQPSRDLRMITGLPEDVVLNPQVGLRRWVFRSNFYSSDHHELVNWAIVEFHHDGSVAAGVWLEGVLPAGASDVRRFPFRYADVTIAEMVALISSHVRGLGGAGAVLIRAELLHDEADPKPLVAVHPRRLASVHPREWCRAHAPLA
ncbi:hypothetical protein [Actinokineospora inagensis]|uniref:hypothetical protein n=1 Tax=Actinokineospora inagensis TaxID=103730 RepID=UPI0004267330|nr:hypothetical protein [Actinokineospora inagensis]